MRYYGLMFAFVIAVYAVAFGTGVAACSSSAECEGYYDKGVCIFG
jgi:hypothetical protein